MTTNLSRFPDFFRTALDDLFDRLNDVVTQCVNTGADGPLCEDALARASRAYMAAVAEAKKLPASDRKPAAEAISSLWVALSRWPAVHRKNTFGKDGPKEHPSFFA